jgi:hypothetical protein
MSQHMGVRLEPSRASIPARSIMPANPAVLKGRNALGTEDKGRLPFLLPLQPAQCPEFIAHDRVRAGRALFDAPDMKIGRSEVNLVPAEVAEFASLASNPCR